MKCAVLQDTGSLGIIQRDDPVCGPYDVVVAVDACGVCRTDRKAFHMGQRDLVMPRVLGHEIMGHIHQVGAHVNSYHPGQRVQVYPGVVCGQCDNCKSGNDHLCDHMQIIGFHLDGGFAQYVLVQGHHSEPPGINKLPDSLDDASATLAEPLACSVNMQKRLDVDQAQSMVIFGAGPLGILSAQLARNLGAQRIIIVEPMEARRKIARQFSDYQLDFDDNTVSSLLDLTHNRGADVVLPCCPGNDAFLMGLECAAKRGRVGFFCGLTDTDSLTNHAFNIIHYRELTLVGAYGCSSADNRMALDLLVTHKVSRDKVPSLDISWDQLPAILSNLDPAEHVFTFFYPTR